MSQQQTITKIIIPVTGISAHGVSPPPASHVYWPVVRTIDGVEVERCADFNTAVARAKYHEALSIQQGRPK